MLFNGKRFLIILFATLLYSPEAWVSGSARISVIEPTMIYSYEANSRKKVHSVDYDRYWENVRNFLDGVLAFGEKPIQIFLSEIKTAGIKIKELDLTKNLPEKTAVNAEDLIRQSQSLFVRYQIVEPQGDTQIALQLEKPLNDKTANALIESAQKIAFHQIEKAWQENGSPQAKPGYFQQGMMICSTYDNYSVGLSLLAQFRPQYKATFENLLQKHLNETSPKIDKFLKSFMVDNKFWLEPKDLISLKEKLGKDFDKKINEGQHPRLSVFNPYGPLFDDFGRRSSAQWGLLNLNLLFVSKNNWENSESSGGNRGTFETEFARLIREVR